MSDGPNVTKLIMKFVSYKAIPKGGGIKDGIEFFTNSSKRQEILAESRIEAYKAIQLIKAAPDNPHGDDDEAIAKMLLEEIEKKEASNRK